MGLAVLIFSEGFGFQDNLKGLKTAFVFEKLKQRRE